MRQPLVSVVIPTYNRLPFLKEAVASIQAQTLKDWELIIVDDCSPDETWEWLQSLQAAQIKVFRQAENAERSAARNKGLSEAKGEFILFLDDDDRLRSNALQDLVTAIARKAKLVAAVGARWKFKKNSYGLRIQHPEFPFQTKIWPELLFGWSAVPSQSLYRTSVVQAVGGWRTDLRIGEDRYLWLKIARLGAVAIIPAIVVEYRAHGGQWRPKDIVAVREKLFQEFISTLPAEAQPRGQRIRSSARQSQQAEENYRAGQYWTAFRHYANACRLAPGLVVSPLTGPPLVRGLAKSLLRPLIRR